MTNKSKFSAVIVCGGSGARMNSSTPKQYMELGDKMVLDYSIGKFKECEAIEKIVLVIAKGDEKFVKNIDGVEIVHGGKTRQESVYNGLKRLDSDVYTNVLIHDGARPFVSKELIKNLVNELESGEVAVIPGVKIDDTIKSSKNNIVEKTIDRETLRSIQTPQGFNLKIIKDLHEKQKGKNCSDDSLLLEKENLSIKLIDGEKQNYKITTREDLHRARKNYMGNSNIRIGKGFDVHAFEEGDGVIMCGVKIPHTKSLKGHSDADVAWHALTDAILGAIGAGDIGDHFSDKDPKWNNANSKEFLQHADSLMKEKGFRLGNADITIICEEPKLYKFKESMKKNTAKALFTDVNQVNIKATTTEKLGYLGRKEGIAAEAVVILTT